MLTTEVLAFIEEFVFEAIVKSGPSPGYTWGRSGNLTDGAWLLNDTVPSDRTGRPLILTNPKLVAIGAKNEVTNTYTLGIYEHDGPGSVYTQKDTIVVTATRGNYKLLTTPIALTAGKELGMKVESGSCKNVEAFAIITGSKTV